MFTKSFKDNRAVFSTKFGDFPTVEDAVGSFVTLADEEKIAIARFYQCLSTASFHYADDSCREWDIADRLVIEASDIRHANTGLSAVFDFINIGNLARA